ncbi:activating transcription factor 7-interacting protein 2 isoform X2 [Oreochromis niloticus]|uniref:Activating transcription factor 7-interacting protein Fn3 domain-containing protein n=1 Tax=Oreochromis niloticus TaxID=8128 RepID=A0A669CND0_ORENI|nr:activating transcription factor 7-interacting protein 2 isoform X2 [Oreochromis niloticus]
MKRRPLTPTFARANNMKVDFSQSDVQKLMEQEVPTATETKLQGLIESIQKLENGVNFERSIEKLEARVKILSKKAEAAIDYVTEMQKKNAVPSLVRANSEESDMETVSQNAMKNGELFQMMEITRQTLKKMRADSKALMAAMADLNEERRPPTPTSPLEYEETTRRGVKRMHEAATTDSNEERLPPVLTPQRPFQLKHECIAKQEKENGKEEFEELEEFEEPKSRKVKVECVSPVATRSPSHTDSEQNGLSLPPLPSRPFPSVLNMEAASYSIPQKLEVNLALIRNPSGLSILWKVMEQDPSAPPMDSYTIFLTMEKVKGSGVFPDWNILGEVKALNLPMCVLVRKYKPGHRVCAAVVGKDVFGRYGPYSAVATSVIPE